MTNNNMAFIEGRVVTEPICDHCLYGEMFYSVKVEVARLSGIVDSIPVTLPGRLLHRHPVMVGDFVGISGELRSYNKQIDRKNRLILTVFAKSIVVSGEMDSRNEVMLTGFVCKPVMYRKTPFAREIADVLIAVNRDYGKSDYIPCIAWGKNARAANGFTVGDGVELCGRFQSRIYQKLTEDGRTVQRTAYEVSCTTIERI